MQSDISKADNGNDESQLTASERDALNKRKKRHEQNQQKLFESRDDQQMMPNSQAQNTPSSSIDSLVWQIKANVT